MKTLEVFTLTFVVIVSSNVNNRFRWLEGVFSGTLPPRSVHKLRCHKQRFEQWPPQLYKQRWNFFMISVAMTSEPHSNEMTSLPILLAAVFLDTGKGFLKSFTGAFSSNSCLNFLEVWAKSMTGLSRCFWDKFMIRNSANSGQSWCSAVLFRKRSALEMQFYLMVKPAWKDHWDSFSLSQESRIWLAFIEVLLLAFL